MLISLKTLQQEKIYIEVDPDLSIADLKLKLSSEKGYDASTQKLIYSGKVLKDSDTISGIGITSSDFMVLMIMKAKSNTDKQQKVVDNSLQTPAVASSSSIPNAPVAAPASESTEKGVPETPTPTERKQKPESLESTSQSDSNQGNDTLIQSTSNTLLIGESYETAIKTMMEMGYERSICERAMKASFNNPDRAVEYLFSGIPETEVEAPEAPQDTPASLPATTTQSTASAAPASQNFVNLFDNAAARNQAAAGQRGSAVDAGSQPNDLSFLENSEEFQQIRELFLSNPEALQPIMEQIAQSNPRLMQHISQNYDSFLELLMRDVDVMDVDGEGEVEGEGEEAEGGENQNYIRVTPEELAVFERLEALGFSREAVLQAYIVCDKNEELAANYLFEHGNDDDYDE
ncbi:UV excision repair protein rhp23 [Smittium culicis]|uniref:UV excision repair protein RAD23 n=1 Tax=Smittium culicis TaxID=133412 RepID=A0A1R1YFS6_9FUNG|nr:UV excision repair protein rhp23 [Smittium culicis]